MNQSKMAPVVLARFPDLNSFGTPGGQSDGKWGEGLAASAGRLIGHALAFKLLAGLALLLLAVAVLPLFFRGKPSTDGLPIAADAVPPWQADPAARPAEERMAATPPRPATIVPALPERSPAPMTVGEIASFPEAKAQPPAPRAPVDAPRMSGWPNPAHAPVAENGSGVEKAGGVADQPGAVRRPVYEADLRGRSSTPWPRPADNTRPQPRGTL